MGLDCSHDAFSGAYSAFNRFRAGVAKVIGGSYPPHEDESLNPALWYWGDGYGPKTHPGLHAFFQHSDCDGELSPKQCEQVADELESLLPKLEELGEGAGHIMRSGGYAAVALRFIAGCREAASEGEPLLFM